MTTSDHPEGLSGEQKEGWEARRSHRSRTLEAMHDLEAALARPAPGREDEWRRAVSSNLALLDSVTSEEADNAERPDSLLSDIARNQPRLRNRVRGVRLQYRHLRETIASLRRELDEHPDVGLDYGDVRQRLSWALSALRHQRARESDLIYEAYYDAFASDLVADAAPGKDGN